MHFLGRLEGKVALITGGTSGIGLETARVFLEEGCRVAIIGRNRSRGMIALAQLGARGDRVVYARCDVSRETDVRKAVSQTVRELGGLDILVNNAGVFLEKDIVSTTEKEWDELININVKGIFLCSKYALRHMRRKRSGVIVNVASDAGVVGNRKSSAYCASKGAVVLLTKAMALDYAAEGIRVNVVCPGEVETPMLWREIRRHGDARKYRKQLLSGYPMARTAKPREVAKAILFLASDDSSFVTGSELLVDGGYTSA